MKIYEQGISSRTDLRLFQLRTEFLWVIKENEHWVPLNFPLDLEVRHGLVLEFA